MPCFPSKKLVSCLPDQAEALTRSPKIKHITFIGSERVGRQVSPISRKTDILARDFNAYPDRYRCNTTSDPSDA